MARTIRLWCVHDAVLVVAEDSGVVYANQVKGAACIQAEAEGILVPLSPDYPVDARGRPTVDTLAERLGGAVRLAMHLQETDADVVDAILASFPETRGVRVDRSRLSDSGEAWIYVLVSPSDDSPMEGFSAVSGVLTWSNSD